MVNLAEFDLFVKDFSDGFLCGIFVTLKLQPSVCHLTNSVHKWSFPGEENSLSEGFSIWCGWI